MKQETDVVMTATSGGDAQVIEVADFPDPVFADSSTGKTSTTF